MPKLEKYLKKRDFSETAEPKGGKSSGKQLTFVVQRHHASRLHYDLRLELDGVLKSWAVPKGPSLNPADKRLAVMVEDHPLDYQYFEGEIPKGNYGAGNVTIWDKGFYEPLEASAHLEKTLKEEIEKGSLKVVLHGKRLKGEFALVKLKDSEENAWLLIKHKDKYAVTSHYDSEDVVPETVKKKKNITSDIKVDSKKKQPKQVTEHLSFVRPMLATQSTSIPQSSEWLFEPKLDGYRVVAIIQNNTVKLFTRNAQDYTTKYKQIADILKDTCHQVILDGEIVKITPEGMVDFHSLQSFMKAPNGKLYYYVFDLIYLNGYWLTELPLHERKELLNELVAQIDHDQIRFTPYISNIKKIDILKKISNEGFVAKQTESFYSIDRRSTHWLKIKEVLDEEFYIAGYTDSTNSSNYLGALIIAEKNDDDFTFVGKCGSGWSASYAKEIIDLLKPYKTNKKTVEGKVETQTKIHYVKPEILCTVKFSERTPDGKLRHPVLKDIRLDKMEPQSSVNERTLNIGRVTLKFTNQQKIFFPELKITKQQVIDYYDAVHEHLLPYLKNRAMSLNRHPNGIHGESFYQKDMPETIPEWLKTMRIYSEHNDKYIDYLVCNNRATLLYLANLGCIEINPWLSRITKLETPDYLVIDLDPEDIEFKYVIETALVTHEVCMEHGLESFIKTSGSTGMHIYLYLGAQYSYDTSRIFAEWLAHQVYARLPGFTSIERSPKKRQKKVYIDFLQNRKGQTIAAPFSLRPKPAATVSWPLFWEEVDENLKMEDYTIFNVPDLLKKFEDPWANLEKKAIDLHTFNTK